MISAQSIERYFTRSPSLSALIYVVLVLVSCLTSIFMVTDIVEQYRTRNTALEMLARFDGHNRSSSGDHGALTAPWPAGSPVLDDKTATAASATLLQGITDVITRAGGTVISSEIERQGAPSKDGYVTVMATCELEQALLQRVLYDIEAGMPFLFIDRLDVQAPTEPGDNARMHVVLTVSGLWGATK